MRLLPSLLLAALVTPVAWAPQAGPGAPAAAAADGTPELLIDRVTPSIANRRSVLSIRGRLANGSDTTIVRPSVHLRLSPTPLISREEVSQVLDGTSARSGTLVPQTEQEVGGELPPGQQANFRIRVPIAQLGLPENSAGVYAFFVEALSDAGPVTMSGTLLPWFPRKSPYSPCRLAMVWPISQRPGVAAQRLVVDPRIVEEYQPGGRVERLTRVGAQRPGSWLVDTAVWQMARELSEGYQVRLAGTVQPGDATGAAASVAGRLSGLIAAEPGVQLPQFAVSDDEALANGGLTAMVVRSASLPLVIRDSVTRGATAGLLYVSALGDDGAALGTLVDAGVRTALIPDSAFPPDPPLPYTPTGRTTLDADGTTIDVVLADSRLTEYLAGPFTTAEQRSTAWQGLLAETAMITLERPAEPRSVVAVPPLLWDPPEGWISRLTRWLGRVPWVDVVDVQAVLADESTVPRAAADFGDGGTTRPLPQPYVAKIGRLRADLESLTRIVDDAAGFGESFSLALQRAASSHWREHPTQRRRLLGTIAEQLRQERARVRVVSSGTVTLAGDSGILPLTVANDLDRSVTVGVELRPSDRLALEYQPPEPVSIPARGKAGLEIPVRVAGSRPVDVTILLTDSAGGLFSDSGSIELRSTAATRIAGVIVGVGGAMLALLVALNVWRRRRAGRGTAS